MNKKEKNQIGGQYDKKIFKEEINQVSTIFLQRCFNFVLLYEQN